MGAPTLDPGPLRHHPLGASIPASPHAVTSSLPTFRDVCAYEEKEPATMRSLCAGYPRFVEHRYLSRLGQHFAAEIPSDHVLCLTSSARAAEELREMLGVGRVLESHETFCGGRLLVPATASEDARKLLQHTGWRASSRQAEDALLHLGELASTHPEETVPDGAEDTVRQMVANSYPGCAGNLFLASCGMSAFFRAFQALRAQQERRGRTRWLQLGWLYLDTGELLRRYTAADVLYDVLDFDSIEAWLQRFEGETAGIVVEVPTNPLIQTTDLPRLSRLCRRYGVALVVDPTIASPINVDVLPHADVVVNSLTKYAGNRGDVMAGVIVVNPDSPFADSLVRAMKERPPEPLHARDLARLAWQIRDYQAVLAETGRAARELADFLEAHPGVARVHRGLTDPFRENYARLVPPNGGEPPVFTVVFQKPLAEVYDKLRMVKGPSFGTIFTIASPFLYLAHYDLVTSPEKRRWLESIGLAPELLRVSVGREPIEELKAAFAEALS